MSFSSEEKQKNPSKAFWEFSSAKKQFLAWNKEKEKAIALPLPAHFVVLDQVHSISGYSDQYHSGGYSNEVHNLKTEPLTVKTFKGGFEETGLYGDIKDKCSSIGLKYTKVLYILYKPQGKDVYALYNLKLTGAANNAWIDAAIDTKKNVVVIKNEFIEQKKGTNTYSVPVFDFVDMNEEFAAEAMRVDSEILQPFFRGKASEREE